MEGGKEQNYWPGFVDVLSNVVLTLVFVLVVFVIALSLSANKVEKKLQEIIEQKKSLQVQENLLASKTAAPVANDDVVIESAEASKFLDDSARTPADIVRSPGKLLINYSASGVDLDENSAQKLVDALAALKKDPNQKILINSYLGNEAYSVAERLAYYRALYLRKFLIEKGYTTGDKIQSRVLQPKNTTEGNNAGYAEIILEGH